MGHGPIFLSDSKSRDPEAGPLYSYQDAAKRQTLNYSSENKPSLIKALVKSALKLALVILAFVLLAELHELHRSKMPHLQQGSSSADKLCPSTKFEKALSFGFARPSQFTFGQMSQEKTKHGDRFRHVLTVGKIEVRVADQDSSSNIRVDLDIRGSDPQLTSFEALGIEQTDSTLIIKTPRHMHSNAASDIVDELPCIFVSATIWISPGTTLENFGINAETLSVIFQPGLQYSVKNRTEIYAHAAALSIEAHEPPAVELTSRDTIIHVKSGSVTGSYPLYDVLDISTISGSIDVTVEPKEASKEKVKPAVLRLSTTSGSINADTSVISVPDRDYQAAVSSVNGGINVKLLHGLRTSLRCESGHITADLYPYGHNDSRTDIQTKCTSGSTDITVHPSITHTSDPLKKLYAGHHGLSGSVNLWYPASWQGLVQGTTASGSISLDWQGLRIVKERKGGWVKKIIEAVRGEGEGRLTMFTTSGSIRLGGDSGGVFVGRKKKCNSMRTDAAQADGEDRFIQKMLGEK